MNNKEHNLHCKSIVETLEKYYNGSMFSYNGNIYDSTELEEIEINGIYHYELEGEYVDCDDVEILSLYDYFDVYYNIDYILDSNKELQAVRIMIACGGPNIYINTWNKRVELFWWSESGEYYLDSELCNAITDIFIDIFNC